MCHRKIAIVFSISQKRMHEKKEEEKRDRNLEIKIIITFNSINIVHAYC